MSRLMKRFQLFIAIVGILCVVCFFAGCGNDDDDDSNDGDSDDSDVLIEDLPPPPTKIVFSSSREASEDGVMNDLYLPRDIFVMDPDGANVINLTKTPDLNDRSPSWSPDGNRIAFSSVRAIDNRGFNSKIFVMDADGANLVNLSKGQVNDWAPAWSPDGKM